MNFEKQALREIYRKRHGLGFLNTPPSVQAVSYSSPASSAELIINTGWWSSQIS